KIAQRIQDPQILHLVKQIIKVGGTVGVPQGGPFSPLGQAQSSTPSTRGIEPLLITNWRMRRSSVSGLVAIPSCRVNRAPASAPATKPIFRKASLSLKVGQEGPFREFCTLSALRLFQPVVGQHRDDLTP